MHKTIKPPNPTTSPNPGKDHQPFWNTVLPIAHDFWNHHRPGDRWNCKCELRSTDEPPTAVPNAPMGGSDPQPGLDNNPGIDAKIFADSHPYIANAYQGAQEAVKKVVKEMESRIEERRAEYQRLLNDPDYKEVHYNSETGGLKATHIGHNEHNPNDKTRFFDNLTQEDLEKECMDWLYSRGHKAILRNEKIFKNNGDLASCLDLELDGTLMDIASITDKDSQYGSALMGKNSQIKRAKQSSGDISDSVLLFFYEPSFFSTQKLLNDIEWYKQFAPACGSEQRIHHVYVAVRGEEKLRKYDI